MFETNVPIIRRKYFIMSNDNDWFIQVDEEDDSESFTSEIEVAYSTYNKDSAFKRCEWCNEHLGMNVKVVKIEINYSLWNESITQ